MPDILKVFTYEVEGLSYEVSVYSDESGQFFADVTVLSGAMDLNALYVADDEHAGDSESLNGPLNMNGVGGEYDGTDIQWDDAIKLSDPGLGPEGEEKETYLSEGETLEAIPLNIDNLEDIAYVGVRATSTTTDEGSIKGVSGDPEEPEDPEDPLHEKVFFYDGVNADGAEIGTFVLDEEPDPNEFGVAALPEDTEPTFANYVDYFENVIGGDVSTIDGVAFYGSDDEGNPVELFRIDAPDDGFLDADELLEAYDEVLEAMTEETSSESDQELAGAEILAALTVDLEDDEGPETEPEDSEEPELELV